MPALNATALCQTVDLQVKEALSLFQLEKLLGLKSAYDRRSGTFGRCAFNFFGARAIAVAVSCCAAVFPLVPVFCSNSRCGMTGR